MESTSSSACINALKGKLAKFSVKKTFDQKKADDSYKVIGYSDHNAVGIPKKIADYVFRSEPLCQVLAYLADPFKSGLCLKGPSGSGKTSFIEQVAARLNWPVQQFTANIKTEFRDFVGQYVLTASPDGGEPTMQFQHGPLVKAMKEGHIFLINEVDFIPPEELSSFNDLIEGRPLVIAENNGETIYPSPMFRVAVTSNSSWRGDDTGVYHGVQMMNMAFAERFMFTNISYAEPEVEQALLEKNYPELPEVVRDGMIRVSNEVRRLFIGSNGEGGDISITISTRILLRWASRAVVFRAAPCPVKYALQHVLLERAKPEEKEAICRIAHDIMGDLWDSNQND